MTEAQIRFAPDILRRLGEELNPSPDQGILELAKNAYDADAMSCTIELIDADRPGGSIRVSDDGDGMGIEAIEKGWLVLGRSGKTTTRKRTRLGRFPVGSKGLGRLAALRMGSVATLITRPSKEETVQYELRINWKDFEDVELVNDVTLEIQKNKRPKGSRHGTEITIERLNARISRIDVKRLARSLILLADPFGEDPKGFKPVLTAPEFSDLEDLVQNRYFNDADFHLVAKLDEKGYVEASVVDFRGEELYSASHEELTAYRDSRPYDCPQAQFDLWAFLLHKTAFSLRAVTLSEVRSWLAEFGGVHVYHNGIRVSPYGNPGDDWLDMNLRRAQRPEERPSTNTAIGRVTVVDPRELLRQKTDRSGFIEDDAFVELKSFAFRAMEWMAKGRLATAEMRRGKQRAAAPKKTRRSKLSLEKEIQSAPKPSRTRLRKALGAYDRSREREVQRLQRDVQLYRTLSTAGITAATFAHESSGNPIKVIAQSIKAIRRRLKKEFGKAYEKFFKKPVEGILRATKSLAVLGAVTLKLLDHEKRRPTRVDLHGVIDGVLTTFDPFLQGRDVDPITDFTQGSPYLRGSEAAIESIITNLINNSLAAFERSGKPERKLLIRTEVEGDVFTLRVLDNGPGIGEGIPVKDIWLPGQTIKKNGTGLGLTIVRDAVLDLGGNVDAVAYSDLGGAEIIIELPILGV